MKRMMLSRFCLSMLLVRVQDAVAVVGYPIGGETISVTTGVVSRIEVTSYSHGATELLGIQIDAAINPGNSGASLSQAALLASPSKALMFIRIQVYDGQVCELFAKKVWPASESRAEIICQI